MSTRRICLFTCLLMIITGFGSVDAHAFGRHRHFKISPSSIKIYPLQKQTFKLSDGATPYNLSIASGSGTLNGYIYTAPRTPGSAVIQAVDAKNAVVKATVTILVPSPLVITPNITTIVTQQQIKFGASGGVTPYSFSIESGGGTLSGNTYTAPNTPGSAVIVVKDTLGTMARAQITIRRSEPFSVTPTSVTMLATDPLKLTIKGGVEPYSFTTTGGFVTPSTTTYTAPVTAGSYSILVTDSFHSSFKINVRVNPRPLKDWTILIFMNGNNSLDSATTGDINEMEKVGSSDRVNVVVQWASKSQLATKRLYIRKDTDTHEITSPVLQDLGLTDMGNYNVLQDFLQWGITHYPAQKYFLVVWNHGGGWRSYRTTTRDISYDDLFGSQITTEQLGSVMNAASLAIGHKVDIYGSDACMMQMIEVAQEMAGSVKIMVGSEETIPNEGWPYTDFLSWLVTLPSASPRQVASTLVDKYLLSYQGGSQGTNDVVTLSAMDLSYLPMVNAKIAELSDYIATASYWERQKMRDAIYYTFGFSTKDFGDLVDFIQYLQTEELSGLRDGLLAELETSVTSYLVINNRVTSTYKRAHGVSMWLPYWRTTFNQYSTRYKALKFGKATGWGNSLDQIL